MAKRQVDGLPAGAWQDGLEYSGIRVPSTADGQRLDLFLSRRFSCSRAAVQARLAGPVLDQSGKHLKWSHRLREGKILQIPRIVRPEPEVEVRYRVLFEDEHLVAVDKGPGAPVHPARSFRTRTILTWLRADLGDERLSAAHRLDRETSGVLLFGRNRQAIAALCAQFGSGQTEKSYLALVHGTPRFQSLRVDRPLGLDPDFPIRCRMRVDERHGRSAQTDLEVLSRLQDRALVRARPRTGRMHQIRVHLASLGHPLLGDKLYLEDGQPYLALIEDRLDADWLGRLGHDRQALHAERLVVVHPASGERMQFVADLPSDLAGLLEG